MNTLMPQASPESISSLMASRLPADAPTQMPKFTREFSAASPRLWSQLARVSVGGEVLGMSSTVVTPPDAAAREPDSQSSLWGCPGDRKCT